MQQKTIKSQLCNANTLEMYKRQCLTLAENVFEFENLPEYIDLAYLNKTLLFNGAIAFFVDEELGLLALPFITLGKLDVYNRPKNIKVISSNGYTKYLKYGEFVIMYDNNSRYPIYNDVIQYSERIALATRVTDINLRPTKNT